MSTLRHTETDLTRFYALFPQPALARDLFNIVEGHRVDTLIRRAYPGIVKDMRLIQVASAERRPTIAHLGDAQAVVESLLQHTLGMRPDLDGVSAGTRAVIGRAIGLLADVEREGASVASAAELATRLYELIDDGLADPGRRLAEGADDAPPEDGGPGERDPAQQQPAPAPGAGGAEDYESLEMPPFMTPVMEEMIRQAEPNPDGPPPDPNGPRPEGESEDAEAAEAEKAMSTSQAQAEGQASEDEVATAADAQTEEGAPGSNPDARTDDAEGGGSDSPEQAGLADVPLTEEEREEPEDLGERVFHYDEWDHKIEDYRPAWCTLTEHRADRTQEGFVAVTFHEFGGIVTQIRRNFQLMRPERMRKMRYQTEGDDLDTDGLVEYVVDRRARIAPSGRVYIKRDKTERDVTTAFVVDMSSSTDRKIDGRKRIIDIEKEALLLMCEALEAIRDEYAIYGFSGSGREDCQFYVVKELGDRYDDRVKGRIGGIYARQKTRMGPALRHATRRLAGADSQVKLMILLTDGKPYDSDTYQDNLYAQEDTKMALREARREKIHLFCVTVDREAADYLPHMYSDANFVIIDDVRTLPQKLPQLYRRLTT
jgi:nitric oxide reductase NorD protein